tara:strand:- start:991 stop:2769 length:1779 start_codon:yes stop_codon:yes gene_type:complete
MAIPGVVPSDKLLSLTNQEEDGSVGAILGSGSAAEAAYRASLAGQNAPIFGKGGFQGATLAPFNQLFSLDDETDDGTFNPIDDITNIISDGAENANIPVVGGATGPTGTFNPGLNTTQYGALTNLVQDNIGDLNISVPGVGDVNVPNLAVNTALDSAFNIVPGLGVVSTLVNPTMVETSWGTPFNTGGGGLIGAVGQLSLNNLENIYGETQSGTDGYDFYAPGSLPGTTTPIGLSPGLFGFGTVVSGNTDMMPSQADLNNDGVITADEVKAFSDPTSSGAQAYQEVQDNKSAANQQMLDYIQSQKDSGGSAFVGGSVVTDSSGKAVTSGDGSKPVTSGGTFTNFGALPDKTETTGNIFSSVGNFFSDFMSSEPEPEPESKPTEDLTSQSIMDAITSGMQQAKDDPRPAGTFEVASSGMFANDASSDDNNNDQSGNGTSSSVGSGISSGSGVSPTAAGEYSTSSSSSNMAATANDKDGTSSTSNDNDSGNSGGGCVIATHGIMTGGFTPMEKAKAELWCQKTYHGKWYGEAFRRGYRAAGQRCIDQGKAREHYQEFKDFVAYGRGVKKGLVLGIKYYARTIQFFVNGLFIKEN